MRLAWMPAMVIAAGGLLVAGGVAGAAAAGATSEATAVPATSATSATSAMDASAPISPEAYRKEIEAWRAERLAGLRNPEGWLTLVGLFWLDEGQNRFGTDPANRVVLPAGRGPAVAGTLERHGDAVTIKAAPGAGVQIDGAPVSERTLHFEPKKEPVIVRLGSVSFFLIQRGDKLGVRMRDSQSPALAAFHGVDSFAVDPSWRVVARFEPYATPKQIPITNILGMTANQPSPGAVVFERDGHSYRLDALQASDGSLFLLFADRTSGRETYGAGRFLDTDAPRDGKVVIDFNKAYNPPCAFTSFATCPLPPSQNHLAVAIDAGEKKYGEGEHAPSGR
jgi:uncharacterized protein